MAKRRTPADNHLSDRPRNQLLRALPEADFQRLQPSLQTIPVRAKQVLQKQGEPIEYVYFVNGGVASITAVLTDGTMVETATVGDEGMIGIEAFLAVGNTVASGESMIQVPDTSAERLSVAAFRRELVIGSPLSLVMARYAQALIAQIMQAAACNARHHVLERCARWLLMTHDRVHQDDFFLSHEFLSMMLGVRRQSVTVVARTLQQAGLIRYRYGQVTILDREGLEATACECYALIRRHFDVLHSALTRDSLCPPTQRVHAPAGRRRRQSVRAAVA